MHLSIAKADLTVDQEKNQAMNNDAWNQLVLTCTNSAFNLITTSMVYDNAYEAWEVLNLKWNKSNIDALVDINQEFWECKSTSD
jgi:hypothetical protein